MKTKLRMQITVFLSKGNTLLIHILLIHNERRLRSAKRDVKNTYFHIFLHFWNWSLNQHSQANNLAIIAQNLLQYFLLKQYCLLFLIWIFNTSIILCMLMYAIGIEREWQWYGRYSERICRRLRGRHWQWFHSSWIRWILGRLCRWVWIE